VRGVWVSHKHATAYNSLKHYELLEHVTAMDTAFSSILVDIFMSCLYSLVFLLNQLCFFSNVILNNVSTVACWT